MNNIFGGRDSWKNEDRFKVFITNADTNDYRKRVFLINNDFATPGVSQDRLLMNLWKLHNTMLKAKAFWEYKKKKNQNTGCSAAAKSSSSQDVQVKDPLIYCDERTKYGVRLNNIGNTTWQIGCDDASKWAASTIQALRTTNKIQFVNPTFVPDDVTGMGGYYWDGPMPPYPEEGRTWETIGQTFTIGEREHIVYVTKEASCPAIAADGVSQWPGSMPAKNSPS
jgi:hypothetical protein